MELRNVILPLNYFKKLFSADPEKILPYPVLTQKPEPCDTSCTPITRCTPEQVGVSTDVLSDFLCNISKIPQYDIHTIMVLRHGKIIFEGEFKPYDRNCWHVSHSLCKTIVGIAIGMLIEDGLLSYDELLCDIFPDKCSFLTSKRIKSINIEHLLSMRSGASFAEIGSVIEKDWVSAFFSYDALFDPGTRFNYNSMNTYMLSAVVLKKTGLSLTQYLTPRLFEPLGFGKTVWEKCPLGIEKGGWGMYILPEDAAKLGVLHLQGGRWEVDGKMVQLVRESHITSSVKDYSPSEFEFGYGYQMWIDRANSGYILNGLFGQNVIVSPELDVVVAMTGGCPDTLALTTTASAIAAFYKDVRERKNLGKKQTLKSKNRLNFIRSELEFSKIAPNPDNITAFKAKKFIRTTMHNIIAKPHKSFEKHCNALNGKVFIFQKCKSGLLPVILSCMNNAYSKGLVQIKFSYANDTLTIHWYEDETVHLLPISYNQHTHSMLNFGGNIFKVATSGYFTTDEDDNNVLKVDVNFIESSSTQKIKFFFLRSNLQIQLNETPNLIDIMDKAKKSIRLNSPHNTSFIMNNKYINKVIGNICRPQYTSISTDTKQNQPSQ